MRKIGELFLLRTNINSVGSVLDSPVSRSLNDSLFPMTKLSGLPFDNMDLLGGILGMC